MLLWHWARAAARRLRKLVWDSTSADPLILPITPMVMAIATTITVIMSRVAAGAIAATASAGGETVIGAAAGYVAGVIGSANDSLRF